MKLFKLILISFIFSFTVSGQSIKFESGFNSWQQVVQKAQKLNKTIFVDVYTKWCGPCRLMESDIFSIDTIGNFYNKNFINIKIDAEVGWGKAFAQTNKITAYPTYLYFSPNGEIVLVTVGAMSAKQFAGIGHSALENKENGLTLEKIKTSTGGNVDVTALIDHIQKLSPLGQPNALLIETYLNTLPTDSLQTKTTLFLVTMNYTGTMSVNGIAFKILLNAYKSYPVKSRELMSPWNTLHQRLTDGIDSASKQNDSIRYKELVKAYDQLEPIPYLADRENDYLQCRHNFYSKKYLAFFEGLNAFVTKYIINADTGKLYSYDRKLFSQAIAIKLKDKSDVSFSNDNIEEFKKTFLSETDRLFGNLYDLIGMYNSKLPYKEKLSRLNINNWKKKVLEIYIKNPVYVNNELVDATNREIDTKNK
ncbi:MAG: Thioredoxin protein [Mucilaginibacter sp.]|nr:Thioredoxin protein [Mucilaginibacter sp.]